MKNKGLLILVIFYLFLSCNAIRMNKLAGKISNFMLDVDKTHFVVTNTVKNNLIVGIEIPDYVFPNTQTVGAFTKLLIADNYSEFIEYDTISFFYDINVKVYNGIKHGSTINVSKQMVKELNIKDNKIFIKIAKYVIRTFEVEDYENFSSSLMTIQRVYPNFTERGSFWDFLLDFSTEYDKDTELKQSLIFFFSAARDKSSGVKKQHILNILKIVGYSEKDLYD